jgi:hypothetical protein
MKKFYITAIVLIIIINLFVGCSSLIEVKKTEISPDETWEAVDLTKTVSGNETITPFSSSIERTDVIPTFTPTLVSTESLPSFFVIPPGMYLVSCFGQSLLIRNIEGTIIKEIQIGETIQSASLKPNTTEIYYSNSQGEIQFVNIESGEIGSLNTEGLAFLPVWAPDGSSFLFTSPEVVNFHSIYLIHLYYPSLAISDTLTDSSINALSPSWAPNGRWIAFLSDTFSQLDTLYKIQLIDTTCIYSDDDCMGYVTLLETQGYDVSDFSWSPDSNEIAFICTSTDDGAVDVCIISLDENTIRRIETDNNERFISWSPNGEWLAITRIISDEWVAQVILMRTDGSEERQFQSDGDEYVLFWFVKE